MPTYVFERPDGQIMEKFYSITRVPEQIVCSDGVEAKRIIVSGAGFILKGPGDHWPSQQEKRKRQMTRNNDIEHKMRKEWNGSQPKLVDTR